MNPVRDAILTTLLLMLGTAAFTEPLISSAVHLYTGHSFDLCGATGEPLFVADQGGKRTRLEFSPGDVSRVYPHLRGKPAVTVRIIGDRADWLVSGGRRVDGFTWKLPAGWKTISVSRGPGGSEKAKLYAVEVMEE